MTDEKKEEIIAPIKSDNSNQELQKETKGIVDKAIETAERLENANKKTEELIQKQEAILARQMLSGKSEASQSQPKTIKDIAQEKAEAVLKRYGYKK